MFRVLTINLEMRTALTFLFEVCSLKMPNGLTFR